MSDAAQIQAIVKDFVLAEFLEGEDRASSRTTRSSSRRASSTPSPRSKLVTYIEEQFEVEIDADEADETHLNTLADIVRLIQSKR
ncbi:MAG: hypothetical protein R3E53_07600 [Myxococcota bacterium]